MSHEHEFSIEALERISRHLDVYKSNETMRREDTLRRIEIKKMFNELSGSKESSSSTMENANFNEVSKIVILYHIFISNLLCFKHYSVVMTCIFVVLT